VAKALAEFEGGGEALECKLALAETQVGEAAEVEPVGLSPGVLAVRVFGAVERVAGVLEGFARVSGREESFGEGHTEFDGVFPEAAGVRQENAGFGLGNGLPVVPQVQVKLAGGVKAAELEFDHAGAVSEGTGVLKVLGRLGRIVCKEEPGEERIGAADAVTLAEAYHGLPVGLRLDECSGSVTAKELAPRLLDAE
jgi:hypothetical protein